TWSSLRSSTAGELSTEYAFPPTLGFLHCRVHGVDHRASNGSARRALAGRRALHEGQLERAGALAVAAEICLRVDPHLLDAVGLREREWLRDERRHQVAPHRQRGSGAREACRAVVVVAQPNDRKAIAGEAREPRIPLIAGGAGP